MTAMAIPPSTLEGRLDRSDVGAALASALLLALAGPPGLAFLVFVAPVPFLLRWARRRRYSTPLWSARLGALLFGAYWAAELFWVVRITRVAWWAFPGWIGQVAILALLGAGFGLVLHAGRQLPLAVTAPLAWVASEIVRADLFGPLRFAWHPLALPLTDWPALLQPAAWVGEAGLGVGILVVASLGTEAIYRTTAWLSEDCAGMEPRRTDGGWRPALLAVVLLGAWGWAGSARSTHLQTRTVASVVLVQPAIPLEARRDEAVALPASVEAIAPLLDAAVRAGDGEIILPETALPLDLDGAAARDTVAAWVARTGRPIWVGGFTGTDDGGVRNALVRFDRSGPTGRWEKVGLVPAVEWGPGNAYRRGAADQAPIPFTATGEGGESRSEPAGVLICIESTRSDLVRHHARGGATWLVNVTNDAWLAEESALSRTTAFRTHPAHLALRAVESGLGVVRVANNGRSGTVGPTGIWTEALPPHLAGVQQVEVRSSVEPTPWRRWGGGLRWLLLALALIGVPAAGWWRS